MYKRRILFRKTLREWFFNYLRPPLQKNCVRRTYLSATLTPQMSLAASSTSSGQGALSDVEPRQTVHDSTRKNHGWGKKTSFSR